MDEAVNEHILVTVLLPVYNSDRYLKETIDSVLSQTHRNFEFLIINDGSTDSSASVINNYDDPRIVFVNNDRNRGLIYTLNRGLSLAKGAYVARIDGDDVCLPERLSVQLDYFRRYPEASVVCSPVTGITQSGKINKDWDVDINTRTPEQIRDTLPRENCIAHPSVMIKTAVAKSYGYNPSQKGSEDWDLWMRLSSDGHVIVKTEERLIKYRYLHTGVTLSDKQKEPVELKVIKVKRRFLAGQILKFKLRFFELRVLYSLLRSVGRHLKLNVLPPVLRPLKRLLTMNPLITYRQYKALKAFCGDSTSIEMFFFFPYCDVGGAEKVHANIVEVFADRKAAVFFTNISAKEGFLYLFNKVAPSFNIGFCLNHPCFAAKSERLIRELIDRQSKPVIFGCNSYFFYETILCLKSGVRVFDLMHDFRFENEVNVTHQFKEQYFRCEKRIFISNKAIEQTRLFYDFIGAPEQEYEKLMFVPNYVDVPDKLPEKDYYQTLNVLYVGRDTPEKRVHLFLDIAEKCSQINPGIRFTAVGEINSSGASDSVRFTGPLYQFSEIEKLYRENHLIVITSEREGFPMSIMEGMAHGMSPVSCPVGDVPRYVNAENGFVTSSLSEENVVNEMVQYILAIHADRSLFQQKSERSYELARQQFSRKKFHDSYRQIIGL